MFHYVPLFFHSNQHFSNKSTASLLLQPVTKILRQLYETQFIRVFSQKLKDSSIKTSSPTPITMLWVSNLSTACSRCNLQTHQKVVVSIYFVTGCLNFSSSKIKFWRQDEIRRMKLYFLETNCHALSYHISKKWKIRISIMAGVPMRFNLSSGFCLMVRYLRTVKMVCIQVS